MGFSTDKEDINDDIVFEMELIKQVEINIDYILELIRKYHASNQENKELLVDINKAIDSSVELRNKKDLIEQFINNMIAKLDSLDMVKMNEINKIFYNMNKALADKDYLLFIDILQYELKAFIQGM